MTLNNILYLSYLIPANRIRPLVPEILPLATVRGEMVFISVVIFHSKDVRLVNLPSMPFDYNQINVRTYVIDPSTGKRGVYFFRTGITSSAIVLLSRFFNLPWEKISFLVQTESNEKNQYTLYSASGYWHGELHIEAKEEGSLLPSIYPFDTIDEEIQYLTGPLIGFYRSSDKTRRFEIKHSDIHPRQGKVLKLRFPFLASLGLLEEKEIGNPHNLLLAPQGQFLIYLPPLLIQ